MPKPAGGPKRGTLGKKGPVLDWLVALSFKISIKINRFNKSKMYNPDETVEVQLPDQPEQGYAIGNNDYYNPEGRLLEFQDEEAVKLDDELLQSEVAQLDMQEEEQVE